MRDSSKPSPSTASGFLFDFEVTAVGWDWDLDLDVVVLGSVLAGFSVAAFDFDVFWATALVSATSFDSSTD